MVSPPPPNFPTPYQKMVPDITAFSLQLLVWSGHQVPATSYLDFGNSSNSRPSSAPYTCCGIAGALREPSGLHFAICEMELKASSQPAPAVSLAWGGIYNRSHHGAESLGESGENENLWIPTGFGAQMIQVPSIGHQAGISELGDSPQEGAAAGGSRPSTRRRVLGAGTTSRRGDGVCV